MNLVIVKQLRMLLVCHYVYRELEYRALLNFRGSGTRGLK